MLNVSEAAVAASSAAEAGVATQIAAATAAASAVITAVLPMGADLDSIQFAAALNAAGAAFIGVASEQAISRGSFAGAQGLAAVTYTASDAVNKAALSL